MANTSLATLKPFVEAANCPKCRKRQVQPKCLPCGHTFCRDCLEDLLEDRIIVCPACCVVTKLREGGGVAEVLDKPLFSRILDAAVRACRNHQKNAVVQFCMDCSFAICDDCVADHDEHKTLELASVFHFHAEGTGSNGAPAQKSEAEVVEENQRRINQSHEDAEKYFRDLKLKVNNVIEEEIKKTRNQKSQELKKLTVRDAPVRLKLPIVNDCSWDIKTLITSSITTNEVSIKIKSDKPIKLPDRKDVTSPRPKTNNIAANRNKFKRVVTSIKTINKAVVKAEQEKPKIEREKTSGWNRITSKTAATNAKANPTKFPPYMRKKKEPEIEVKHEPEVEPEPEVEEEVTKETEEERFRNQTVERMKIKSRFTAAVSKLMSMDQAPTFKPLYEGERPEERQSSRAGGGDPLLGDGTFSEVWESKLGMDVTDAMWDAGVKGWVIRLGNLMGTRGDLCQVDLEGTLVDRVGQGLVRGNGRVGFDSKRGGFIVTDGCQGMMCLSRQGELLKEITIQDSESLFGVTYCACEDIYVISDTDKHCLWYVSADTGAVLYKIGSEGDAENQFDLPLFVTHRRGPNDVMCHIFVTDTNNSCIKVLSSKGKFTSRFGNYGSGDRQLRSPYGTVVDPHGRLVVCDHYNRRVVRYWYAGTEVSGGSSEELRWDVALDEGQLKGRRPWCVSISSCGRHMLIGLEGKDGVVMGYTLP